MAIFGSFILSKFVGHSTSTRFLKVKVLSY
jgi:hypothetical protein